MNKIGNNDDQYKPTNRDKVKQPTGDKSHWCRVCDSGLVKDGSRCKRCKQKDRKKRFKFTRKY